MQVLMLYYCIGYDYTDFGNLLFAKVINDYFSKKKLYNKNNKPILTQHKTVFI